MNEQRAKDEGADLTWLATAASQQDTAWHSLCAKSRHTPTPAPTSSHPPRRLN